MASISMAHPWRIQVCAMTSGALTEIHGAKCCAIGVSATARPWRNGALSPTPPNSGTTMAEPSFPAEFDHQAAGVRNRSGRPNPFVEGKPMLKDDSKATATAQVQADADKPEKPRSTKALIEKSVMDLIAADGLELSADEEARRGAA